LVGEPVGPFPDPGPAVPEGHPFFTELSWLTDARYEGAAWQAEQTVAFDPAPTAPVLRRTMAAALYRAEGEGHVGT